MKTVAILGSGLVGQTLAGGFAKHGWGVVIGTGHPEKKIEWKDATLRNVKVTTYAEAAEAADLVVVAVKGTVAEGVVHGVASQIAGKVVIDASNPIADAPPDNGVLQFFTALDKSLMERLQKLAPEAHFVKAFNSVGAVSMVNPDFNPDGDYADSIDVAKKIALTLGLPFEGGVKNIAKRDGLGIVMLEAVSQIGKLPDHYVQAVGSGTGAIGAWEMAERFVKDGRFGSQLPALHLGQNLPFVPMVHAWEKSSRTLFPQDLNPELISHITTRVLSTRYPAYSVHGGVFDALTASSGAMYGIENVDVYAGMDDFNKTEGVDIVPASGVAVGVLKTAVKKGRIKKKDTVLLNITGGGEARLRQHRKTYSVMPQFISKKASEKEIEELLCHVLKKSS